MAVTAYASLLSLTDVLENLHYRVPFHLPLVHVEHVQTLQEKVQFLLEFTELNHLETETAEIVDLWRHMAKVAFEAEETIDFHVVNLLYLRSQGETSNAVHTSTFCDDLERMISEIDIIQKDLPEISEACKPAASVPAGALTATFSSCKNVVVGFDEHILHIKDQLTRNKDDLQILAIVGMGGIGKTTLAKSVYDDPYIANYFDKCIWVTISQEFSVEEILGGLLDVGEAGGTCESSTNELGEKLYKELFGRKYLIIMDDVWSTKAWDELKRYFPDNGNGSRILVTTRLTNVAACLSSLDYYPLSFLDRDNSWDLFCRITFAQRGCPYTELEEIGRDIAKGCGGLPLGISVIGRLLANSDMTREYWELVDKNISSFGNLENNEHCLKILSLSYKSLPIHLKPCFLYLRVFREDEYIKADKLGKYWVAEGFIKPTSDKTLEEIAEQYAEDLIDRSLMFEKGYETYGVHDLLRDLSIKESNRENFIESPKVIQIEGDQTRHCVLCGKTITINDEINFCEHSLRFPPSSQDSLVACDAACQRKYSHITKMKLVTPLTIQRGPNMHKLAFEFLTELRHLTLQEVYDIHHVLFHQTIHLLWNLEILDISLPVHHRLPVLLPAEIWEMPKLRHVRVNPDAFLANPISIRIEGKHFIILKNLQSLSLIINFNCAKEVLDRIPNLKDLYIMYENDESVDRSLRQSHYSLCNLAQLQKLKVLKVENALENITFPNSLQELMLQNYQMTWEDMSIIGSLPFLEVLRLYDGVEGSEWNIEEGQFVRLKRLEIAGTHLQFWRADTFHFLRYFDFGIWIHWRRFH